MICVAGIVLHVVQSSVKSNDFEILYRDVFKCCTLIDTCTSYIMHALPAVVHSTTGPSHVRSGLHVVLTLAAICVMAVLCGTAADIQTAWYNI